MFSLAKDSYSLLPRFILVTREKKVYCLCRLGPIRTEYHHSYCNPLTANVGTIQRPRDRVSLSDWWKSGGVVPVFLIRERLILTLVTLVTLMKIAFFREVFVMLPLSMRPYIVNLGEREVRTPIPFFFIQTPNQSNYRRHDCLHKYSTIVVLTEYWYFSADLCSTSTNR